MKTSLPQSMSFVIFTTHEKDKLTVSEGYSFCEVSPCICPTEAVVDTAALEKKTLLAETRPTTHRHDPVDVPYYKYRTMTKILVNSWVNYYIELSPLIHEIQVSEKVNQNKNTYTKMTANVTPEQLIYLSTARDWERKQDISKVGLLIILG